MSLNGMLLQDSVLLLSRLNSHLTSVLSFQQRQYCCVTQEQQTLTFHVPGKGKHMMTAFTFNYVFGKDFVYCWRHPWIGFAWTSSKVMEVLMEWNVFLFCIWPCPPEIQAEASVKKMRTLSVISGLPDRFTVLFFTSCDCVFFFFFNCTILQEISK